MKYQAWISSDSVKSYQVLNQLRFYHELLGDRVTIQPNYILWYSPSGKLTQWKSEENKNCFSGGRYCAPDPGTPRT